MPLRYSSTGVALALHYANVIILIEKLASSPHLISLDARDDLYCMLPTTVRTTLRANLKIFKKSLTSSIYDAALASEGVALSKSDYIPGLVSCTQ
ncbi:hypothetical protein Leryth_000937 [Lithospermum erythrorhizon]|nr:hypothetical protein Leryth_000937 [Lithospermum erythrorhizon]